jgi:hypothetical protein
MFYADRRINYYRCLLRCLPTPQDAGTPANITRHTRHLGGHLSRYYPGPTLHDFADQLDGNFYKPRECGATSTRRRTTAHFTVVSTVLCSGYVVNKTVSFVLMNVVLVSMMK